LKKRILQTIFVAFFLAQLLGAQTKVNPAVCTQPLGASPSALAAPQIIPPGCPSPAPVPTPVPTPAPTPITGSINPKYLVVTVTYAPPGSSSNVTYSNTTMLGTSVSLSDSFTNDVSVSTSATAGFSIFGIGASETFTASADLSQESDSSTTTAINESSTRTTQVRGPSSSAVGIDHNEDVIWVWLNPVLRLAFNSPTSLAWSGFGYDINDPVGGVDIVGIPVKFLNGHAPMPAGLPGTLARVWAQRVVCDISTDPTCGADGTDAPGLTASDLASILEADPLANPAYVVNIPTGASCTLDQRFCITGNQNLQYLPAPPGGQPITQTYSLAKQATATGGTGGSDTQKLGFSVTANATGDDGILADIKAKLTVADTLTWTHKWSNTTTQQVGQTAALSITGPASTDNYTGPVEFDVFQDNLYGTFMFNFINVPTFSIAASPATQSAVQGSCAGYIVSTSPLISGFTSVVALNVVGLPANATASFSPATITGAGSSTMTVCTATSSPVGTSSLTITGTQGTEVHNAPVSLTVVSLPDFTMSATPASQSTVAGAGAGYSLSTTAISGFSGSVALSVSGVPFGATAHFTAPSIVGAGSSTLIVSTTSATSAGSYLITVTGTSGSLSHSVSVILTVTAPKTVCPHVPCTVTE
jgi:hypothetical protein